jgi:hypothetical protein
MGFFYCRSNDSNWVNPTPFGVVKMLIILGAARGPFGVT